MADYLRYGLGFRVNEKRIGRLYKPMGLKTVYAKPRTTIQDKENCIYPYLLWNLQIDRPNQVWQTDITYILMYRGLMYLVAIIDVYSRKTMNRSVSNTMSAAWCTEVLEYAIKKYGKPQIHNSGQEP